jgi:hypothetical protein
MDPIHPILPQPLNIPPVLPATGVGRVDRDGGRSGKGDQDASARRQQRQQREVVADVDVEGEPRPHVDITA